jgi:signal transduction histidine kinase
VETAACALATRNETQTANRYYRLHSTDFRDRQIESSIQLQQVLMNLMINGIDATKAVDGPRQLTLGTQNDSNEQLLVSVEDTGIGLPPNQAGQIFNAFFTTKEHGTGMGLRISRTIIEAHGGRLWATDNHPRGASFHFTLAVSPDAASLGAD